MEQHSESLFRTIVHEPPKCMICGEPLQQKAKYDYQPPFIAPKNWCPDHGYWRDQAIQAAKI